MKNALVYGGGGFIGGHLVKRLKRDGYWVRVVDLKLPEFNSNVADDYIVDDLRDTNVVYKSLQNPKPDAVFQLAADMGGAEYVFTGDHDADIMHNSAIINLNLLSYAHILKDAKIFYSSSACMYPEHNQLDPENPNCKEDSAYPANPDSEYGWEKLFSERLYLSFARNYGLDVSIARFHNIFGPYGCWKGGREKAPAAFCRKVVEAVLNNSKTIECFGDGEQTRSFLYVDECVEGILRLVDSDFAGPVNIGSDEMVSINKLIDYIAEIAGVDLKVSHIKSNALGVRGRNSDNELIKKKLNWAPNYSLKDGLAPTYKWVREQVKRGLNK